MIMTWARNVPRGEQIVRYHAKPGPRRDGSQSYMPINSRSTHYHYCQLPPSTFDSFLTAPSMGQFYNQNIKGAGSDGPYDCRTHRVGAELLSGLAALRRVRPFE
jgi:hypothetical protein